MEKIHGDNMFILFLSLVSSFLCVASSLDLDVISLDGDFLEGIGAGQPFVVQVKCNDMEGNCSEPVIEGIEQLEVEGKRFAMHTVGKQSTVVHSYTVRIDTPGSYILGPARVKDVQGQEIKSDAQTLSVGSEHSIKKKQSKNKHYTPKQKKPSYFLRVYADSDTAYIGERIECIVRLYHDKAINPQPIEQRSDLKKNGLKLIADEAPPEYGEKEIDGKRYGYYQWKFDIISDKSGRVVLPAFNTLVPADSSWPRSFFMAQSFKRIYSNALALKIVPLDVEVQDNLVGRFSSLTSIVSPGAARQGSAMTLTIELEGDKNVANVDHFIPKNIPDGLRIYESSQRIKMLPDSQGYVKEFEFVLHGVKSGEWEVPSQSLAYFDPTDRQCKEVVSAALQVSVLPGHSTKETDRFSEGSSQKEVQKEEEIRDIVEHVRTKHIRVYMPWWLFILLLLPLVTGVSFTFVKKIYSRYGEKYTYAFLYRFAFTRASWAIRSAQRTGSCERLYKIFIKLFATRLRMAETSITESLTQNELRSRGVNSTLIQQWIAFFYNLERASFKSIKERECVNLCKQALQWITILQKNL